MILIVGGGLMMYMANLVKSAYEIKVQINTEVEERLSKMGEDLDKKSRWIKRDLLEEIEKIKGNLFTENATKMTEAAGPLMARLDQIEAALRNERVEWVKAVDSDRAAIANIDNRLKTVSKQVKSDDKPAAAPAPAPIPAAASAPQPANHAVPGEPAASPPPTPGGIAAREAANSWLPELGSSGR